jgi:hypothetical protein
MPIEEEDTMTDEDRERYFEYLDRLRESGATNMYGAAPYLRQRFGLDRHEAGEILMAWMDGFEARHPQ